MFDEIKSGLYPAYIDYSDYSAIYKSTTAPSGLWRFTCLRLGGLRKRDLQNSFTVSGSYRLDNGHIL